MSFWKVVVGAVLYLWHYRLPLLKALLVPFALMLVLELADRLHASSAVDLLSALVWLAVFAVFAITTHRIVLLGPGSVPPWGIGWWSKREWRFLLYLFGFTGLLLACSVVLSFLALIPFLGVLVGLLLTCWLAARLSLVFPALALEEQASFRRSWQMTRDYQGLMIAVVVLFPVLIAVVLVTFRELSGAFAVIALLSSLVLVFEVAVLSVAYQHIAAEHQKQCQ